MKKILALVMVVAMLACFASVTSAAAPAGQIAWYGFDGNDAGLTANGEVTYADGVATLGADGWFLSDVDLKGAEELTVAYKVLVSEPEHANWAFEITSEESHSWPNEHYLGVLLNTGFTVERYNNAGARPANATGTIVAGEWFEMVCVYPADGSIIVYVDGVEVANVPQTEGYDLAIANCIGETPALQIGKANWGEYSNGASFDTLAVYNRALTADEVATALEAPAADAPQTGFATVALAVVAVLSGAYIVTKKH